MTNRQLHAVEEAVSEVLQGEDIITAVNNACFDSLVQGEAECLAVYEAVAHEVGIADARD